MQKLLNLGCGSRYITGYGWTNIDFNGTPGIVIGHDISKSIPFMDCTFDVVYHSHLLEHLSYQNAPFLLQECFRVLKPAGIIRIVIPDLEDICREYLKSLDDVLRFEANSQGRYKWMVIELIDQMVRHYSGGEMAIYIRQPSNPEIDFVLDRVGSLLKPPSCDMANTHPSNKQMHISNISRGWRFIARHVGLLRKAALSLVLTRSEMHALEVGLFRLQGEPHLWMYDRYSLCEMMKSAGFKNIEKCKATYSSVIGWEKYCLDTDKYGAPHKPYSLYVEGVRVQQ